MNCYKTLFIITILVNVAFVSTESSECEALAQTESGWVCGARRLDRYDKPYASFRGIPYAKQPLGELRFQELQPAESWDDTLNATIEGSICPNHDIIFGPLVQPQGVSESCIYVNVHVPMDSLPNPQGKVGTTGGLPIVVFVHSGAWVTGSGDADFNGPEYIVGKGVVVITFNYRLDVFGLLSLNSTKIPGNGSLRDMVTLLRWVQANARYFGGNPDEVTLSGHSAGAASVHLLSLSPAAAGLFKRIWITSGAALQSFVTTSPVYAQQVSSMFIDSLGLNTTDNDEIHDLLIKIPLDELIEITRKIIDQLAVVSFLPVVETPRPGFTTILPEDPEALMAKGNGNNIPMVIGFTNRECDGLRTRLEEVDILERIENDPLATLSPSFIYSYPPNVTEAMAEKVKERYFSRSPSMDEYMKLCTDSLFAYPALKTAQARVAAGGAPVYLYKFAYTAEYSALKQALNLSYSGAGHFEDLNHIFKVNSWPVPESDADEAMTDLMSGLFANFIKYKLWLMSGTAIPSFYTTSPTYAQQVTTTYLSLLGINSTDYDAVHDQLVQMPLEVLNNASGVLLAQLGVTSFVPVVESPLPGVTAIITADPETLIANGNGNNIPIVIGFTSDECEANRPRLTEINAVALYQANPLAGLSPHLVYTLPANVTAEMSVKVDERYFAGTVTMDKFVRLCTETYFAYPAIKLARARWNGGGAPVYLYKFGYEPEQSVFQTAFNLNYDGAGHSEDMNHVFKVNSLPLPESASDDKMKARMSDLFANFVKNGVPSYESHKWRPLTTQLNYNHVYDTENHQYTRLDDADEEMVDFFDTLADV